ncbi:hypothetical protein NLJ89_g5460 [Agrocybe chaxingu]|uniref:Uncharacterized protein n=1 Tax=Agrocybe chaxingu TaxID=84603 RepID=A0A9W8MTL0_9AGAR|nr:hypothetical protein NLJ89_g5460 [Agrocybe chaxingu]
MQADEKHKVVFQHLHAQTQQELKNHGKASHQQKRLMVPDEQLSIRAITGQKMTLNISELLAQFEKLEDAAAYLRNTFDIRLILRNRYYPVHKKQKFPGHIYHKFKQHCPLIEMQDATTQDNSILCTEAEGFYVLSPDTSAIFVSQNSAGGYDIELAVIRHAPRNCPYGEQLLEWLQTVVQDACYSRRDIRPSHTGEMVQIGLNMGPRHARILGWAKSFTRNLSDKEKTSADTDLIGAMSLFWGLIEMLFPTDITHPVQKILDEAYPTMATRNVPMGCGFSIMLDGVEYNYSTSKRAPPEGYATAGYVAPTHYDPCYIKWAFTWTVGQELSQKSLSSPNTGSSFVDLGLRVVVKSSVGTIMAFQPNELHGTTERHGTFNYGLSLTSTKCVRDGYLKLEESGVNVRQYLEGTPS